MRSARHVIAWSVAVFILACLVSSPIVLAEERTVRLEIVITAEETGEPIENAAIYAKFKQARWLRRDKKVEWSAKTDPDGKAVFPALHEGRVLLQVVAKGWKTYGRYHTLKGPKHVIEIKLKPPKKWY